MIMAMIMIMMMITIMITIIIIVEEIHQASTVDISLNVFKT